MFRAIFGSRWEKDWEPLPYPPYPLRYLIDMGADGIFLGGGVDPQNGAAAATFDPGGGVDTTERIS